MQISMCGMVFEPLTPALERAKDSRGLDRAAAVIATFIILMYRILQPVISCNRQTHLNTTSTQQKSASRRSNELGFPSALFNFHLYWSLLLCRRWGWGTDLLNSASWSDNCHRRRSLAWRSSDFSILEWRVLTFQFLRADRETDGRGYADRRGFGTFRRKR
jgi:hypothetical protein